MQEPKPRRRRDTRLTEPPGTRPTDRHRELFELLDPFCNFKYLTSKWAHAFIGGNEHAFKVMLRKLFDAGDLDRPKQQAYSPNSNYKHLVYERTAKAARVLTAAEPTKHQLSHRSNSYPHEILVDLGFYAPMRYAVANDPALKLYTTRELLDGAAVHIKTAKGTERMEFPNPTRFNPDPFLITLKNKDTMRFDGTPFLLERTKSDGTGAFIFVPGIEADRNTEGLRSVKPKDPLRTTLTGHLTQIMDFFGERGFMKHYGFNMMMVPIITTNETHTQNAMAFVEKEIGMCKYLLFKTLPDLAMEAHFPAPSGDFFTTRWRRVGYPDFNLATFEEG